MNIADLLSMAIYYELADNDTPDVFTWDKKTMRYRSKTTGKFVAKRTIESLGDNYIDNNVVPRMEKLTQKLIDGDLRLENWQQSMAKEIKDAWIVELQIGAGGRGQLTQVDYGRMGARLREQYKYLNQFAQEINASGGPSANQIMARVKQYGRGARTAYYDGQGEAAKKSEYTEERRVTTPAEHCDDCLGYEAEGWQPIGYFPKPGIASACGNNCKCRMEYR